MPVGLEVAETYPRIDGRGKRYFAILIVGTSRSQIWQDASHDTAWGQMAQVDYFIKFDGIKGESTDAKHKDEIDVEAGSWGVTHAAGPGGGGGAKVSMQDFHFVMRLNKASVGLMKACATGQHLKEATLSARKAGKQQQEYLVLKFQDVLISSYQTGGSEGGDIVPTDQVSFNFAKIDVEYRPQKADGSLDVGIHFKYDIKANKPL
jgi:type VI secretion system secreted protein Hcp